MSKQQEFNDWDQWLNVHRLENELDSKFRNLIDNYIREELSSLISKLKEIDPTNRMFHIREAMVSFQEEYINRLRAANRDRIINHWEKYLNVDRLRYLIKVKEHLVNAPGTFFREKVV
jgi:hypothetical protein